MKSREKCCLQNIPIFSSNEEDFNKEYVLKTSDNYTTPQNEAKYPILSLEEIM